MRTLGVLSVLTALAIGLHYSGVVNFDPAMARIVQFAQKADMIERDSRHVIVGLDITAGREGELEKDRQAISKLVNELQLGDSLSVYLIHSRAESEQEAVFTARMPENSGPAGRLLAREKKVADDAWRNCWEKSVLSLVRSDKAQRTDLFGFMRFVATQKPDFMENRTPTMILFTDGQQVGDGFNMEKKAPSRVEIDKAIRSGLVPDMKKVRLIFAGVTPTHRIENAHWRKIQSFWRDYGKVAHAQYVSVSSERDINLK